MAKKYMRGKSFLHYRQLLFRKKKLFFISLLLLCMTGHLSAQVVQLDFKQTDLAQVVAVLQKQAIQYKFSYQPEALEKIKLQNVHLKATNITPVLEQLKKQYGLHYLQDGKNISFKYVPLTVTPATFPKKAPGKVTGKIIDEESGQPLEGATISIGNKTVNSAIDGSFDLLLPKGSYTATVSFVGYGTKEVSEIDVKDNEIFTLNVILKRDKNQLEAVVIRSSAKKEGVNALYVAQKNAASVTDGISAEQIARTPDNDMGQVLKRITGLTTVDNKTVIVRGMSDRYNQAMLDGVVIPSTSMNKRNFSFDIIPTEMVSNVVVNKTATPDVSSEFSGGQVSINTLSIPSKNFTIISLGTGGNSQTIGKDFYHLGERHNSEYLGYFDKSAKLPEGMLTWQWDNETIRLDAPPGTSNDPLLNDKYLSYDRPDLKYNDLDAIAQSRRLGSEALKLQKYTGKPNQNYRLALGRVYNLNNNLRFGFSASANLRSEQTIVKFNNVRGADPRLNYLDSTKYGYNGGGTSYRFNSSSGLVANLGLQGKDFKIALKNMYARIYSDNYNEAIRLDYRDITHGIRKEVYQLPEAMSLQQHQLTGEYSLPGDIKFDGMLAYNKIGQQIIDERKLQYRLTAKLGEDYFFQTPNLLRHSSWSNNTVAVDSRMWTHINEDDYNWAANFSKSLGQGSVVSTLIKLGYQGWRKQRNLDVFRMLPMTRSAKAGELTENIELPYEELLNENNIGAGKGQAYYYAENIGGRVFSGDMNSHAIYLMADQKLWGKLRLVYGARLEYYDLSNRQEELLKRRYGNDIPDYMQFQARSGEKDWRLLPSVNATYSFTSTFNFRASYSKTAIRPDFRETSFFGFYDYELDANVSGQDVVSTMVDNLDARLEWYPAPGEIISLTGYYKYLDKPIELVNNPSFQDGSYYIYSNMESARNYGLELELRKNFSFIGRQSWLSDLFVYANGSLLKSKVNYMGPWEFRTTPGGVIERFKERVPSMNRPLIGQSPWLLNLGLGYWGERLGATASYNHRGYRSNLIRRDPQAIEYELAPRQLDIQLYGRFLKKKVEVKLNIANLLNEWTRYYINPMAYEQIAPGDVSQGYKLVKGDNGYKKADGDIITYRRQDGLRFSLSFTYNF